MRRPVGAAGECRAHRAQVDPDPRDPWLSPGAKVVHHGVLTDDGFGLDVLERSSDHSMSHGPHDGLHRRRYA